MMTRKMEIICSYPSLPNDWRQKCRDDDAVAVVDDNNDSGHHCSSMLPGINARYP